MRLKGRQTDDKARECRMGLWIALKPHLSVLYLYGGEMKLPRKGTVMGENNNAVAGGTAY